MTELATRKKENIPGDLLERLRPATRIKDWLTDPGKYIEEIENTEMLVDRLIFERELLLNYSKAMRLWAYGVIGGNGSLNETPRDVMLLEAMNNLPDYLRNEIQRDD